MLCGELGRARSGKYNLQEGIELNTEEEPGTSHSIVQEARAILGSDFGTWISYSSGNKFVLQGREFWMWLKNQATSSSG